MGRGVSVNTVKLVRSSGLNATTADMFLAVAASYEVVTLRGTQVHLGVWNTALYDAVQKSIDETNSWRDSLQPSSLSVNPKAVVTGGHWLSTVLTHPTAKFMYGYVTPNPC
jgi:hypothetical protein